MIAMEHVASIRERVGMARRFAGSPAADGAADWARRDGRGIILALAVDVERLLAEVPAYRVQPLAELHPHLVALPGGGEAVSRQPSAVSSEPEGAIA